MRKLNKFILAMFLAATFNTCVQGAEKSMLYKDVPLNHWAYKAIEELTEKGLVIGLPDKTFTGNKPLTRYSFAVVINRMLARYDEILERGNFVSQKDLKTLEDLVTEFINEIESISEEVKQLKEDVKVNKADISKIKGNIKDMQAKDDEFERKLSTINEVKVSGDVLLQGINYKTSSKNMDDYQNAQVRIGFSAKPTDKVETEFRYVAYNKDMDSNNDRPRMQNINGRDPNGTSKSQFGRARGSNEVEIAKVKVNKVFKDEDSLEVGRTFKTHGHGLVINDYADAVTYETKAGDVKLTGNAIFADYDNGLTTDKKGQQIWNINADVNARGHNIYAGLYQQNTGNYYEVTTNNLGEVTDVDLQYQDRVKQVAEVGSSGNVTSDGKLRYDVAMVASSNERKNMYNNGRKDRATGYMEHVAVTWDAAPNLVAKVAYTTADKNFDGIISLDKNQGSVDGKQTPFDDIARFHNLLGGMENDKFANTSNLKLQLEHSFANNQSVRFAYDIVKENHDVVQSGFTEMGQPSNNYNMAGYNKLDAKISTLEYKYQFDPGTRLSFGFTNADKSECRDEADQKMKDEQLIWTEVFSKF